MADFKIKLKLKLAPHPLYFKMTYFKLGFNSNLARCPPFWKMADLKIKLNLKFAPYPPYYKMTDEGNAKPSI